jgi:(2Fe-2S) ferredoxin
MPRPQHHLFVCQNERAADNPRGCCLARGGKELLNAFKQEIGVRGLRERIEFDGSSCLDCCAWGPTVVVYPENVWYGKVTPEDVPAIVEAIANGLVIDRLLIPDEFVRRT